MAASQSAASKRAGAGVEMGVNVGAQPPTYSAMRMLKDKNEWICDLVILSLFADI
jgi:hypothetical protein